MRGLRIHNKDLRAKITYATDAAELIKSGYKVGMSGSPVGVSEAGSAGACRAHPAAAQQGGKFRIVVMTGASTSSELDGALSMVDGIELRMPYNSGPDRAREKSISEDGIFRLPPRVGGPVCPVRIFRRPRHGDHRGDRHYRGRQAHPSTSVGNNQVFIDCARR